MLIGKLSEFPYLRPAWRRASEAIGRAARTGNTADIEVATAELAQALAEDGLLTAPPERGPSPGRDGGTE